jgi:hypothetical protein
MNDIKTLGEFIRLNDSYDWGNGKYAGQVVRVSVVQDDRDATDDPEALIYEAEFVNEHGEVCDRGIPVLPSDVDETYDHYEARQAATWNNFLSAVMA